MLTVFLLILDFFFSIVGEFSIAAKRCHSTCIYTPFCSFFFPFLVVTINIVYFRFVGKRIK